MTRRQLICHQPNGGTRGYTLIEMLVVLGLAGVIGAIAVPMMANTMADFRLSGDARGIHSAMSVAKMRAASAFSQSRLYVDLDAGTYHVETLSTGGTPAWTSESGTTELSTGVSAGYGNIKTAPPNTQNTIGQAPACRTTAGVTIGNTACVVFNSRGVPVDSTGTPTALDAVYLTDGVTVYVATAEASGMIQLWNSSAKSAAWVKQ